MFLVRDKFRELMWQKSEFPVFDYAYLIALDEDKREWSIETKGLVPIKKCPTNGRAIPLVSKESRNQRRLVKEGLTTDLSVVSEVSI